MASVRDQDSDGSEVDFAEDGFHQATGEECHFWSFGLMGGDEALCVSCGGFESSGFTRGDEGMDGHA